MKGSLVFIARYKWPRKWHRHFYDKVRQLTEELSAPTRRWRPDRVRGSTQTRKRRTPPGRGAAGRRPSRQEVHRGFYPTKRSNRFLCHLTDWFEATAKQCFHWYIVTNPASSDRRMHTIDSGMIRFQFDQLSLIDLRCYQRNVAYEKNVFDDESNMSKPFLHFQSK